MLIINKRETILSLMSNINSERSGYARPKRISSGDIGYFLNSLKRVSAKAIATIV